MKQAEPDLIRNDVDALASETEDARCGLKEPEQLDKTGIGIIITEAVLVLVALLLWWFARDTPFMKSPWFPWVAVAFPIIALGVPGVLTIRSRKRRRSF